MDNQPHWDFKELLERLKPPLDESHTPIATLKRDAAAAIETLMATNRDLNRRAQTHEASLPSDETQKKLNKALRDERFSREWAISSFSRMGEAFQEIKRIYEHIRRARPDGCDGYGYHSVNDMKFGGGGEPGAVWANIFKSRQGGIVSVRPAEIIGPLVDELIAFRKFFGSLE